MLYQKEASLIDTLVFTLSDFEGPLDLLLYLVSKNKMQIADVEIVSLIDQYLAVVNGPAGAELDQTSEFIEMAARLIYMKSVFLLPRSPEADQLRQELTGQLVEYSACKQAAAMLGQMADGIFFGGASAGCAGAGAYLFGPAQRLGADTGAADGAGPRPKSPCRAPSGVL